MMWVPSALFAVAPGPSVPARPPTPEQECAAAFREINTAMMGFFMVGAIFSPDEGQALECWRRYLELWGDQLISDVKASIRP